MLCLFVFSLTAQIVYNALNCRVKLPKYGTHIAYKLLKNCNICDILGKKLNFC